ncbi:hypothetical protein BDB00DRAFT_795984 [Zychaea mexicana]|uniref:uncharacterized protein n=1 Tax=Zychaea mexicana TaxID=64656 RepID=UPI0022FF208F|nr:uncharacterized protein BDB00DRAFT_795984 [Zychaea mexicana]KAI9499240.1 hypothetical protein BDB00DRAFT_795984 [Zychaea mexicana]
MLRRPFTMLLPKARIPINTVAVRHAHTANLQYRPLKIAVNPKMTRSLRDAVRRHNAGAVWSAYTALHDNNQLNNLPAEYHSMALHSFRIKKLVAYGPEEIEAIKERLLFVWNNMHAAGHQPDVRDYNHLIDFFGRANDWESCAKYWEELEGRRSSSSLWSGALVPNVYSYNLLMRAAIMTNRSEQVFVILNKMKSAGIQPNGFTYDTMIEAHGRLGNVRGADRAFQERYGPKEKQAAPSPPPKKSRFASLLSSYSTPPAANPDVLGTLVRETTAPESKKPRPSTHTFVALIDAHGRQGYVRGLDYIYNTMLPGYKVKPDLELYNTMIRWYCEHRNVDKARRVFFDLERSGLKPSVVTFNYIFRHEALRERNPRTAETLLELMNKMYDLRPLESMYRALIKSYNKRNKEEDADRLFREYISAKEPSQR